MYKHCNTESGAQRQRQFESCLLALLEQLPYCQITVADLCHRMGLSRKSFYRYFGSKEDCLHALIDRSILDFSALYLPDHGLSAQDYYEHYFTYWRRMKPLLEALCQNRLSHCLLQRTILCAAQEDRALRGLLPDQDREDSQEQLLFFACGLIGLLLHWHNSGYQKTPGQMADTLIRLMTPQPAGDGQ